MRPIIYLTFIVFLISSCSGNGNPAAVKYPDQFLETIKGEPLQVEVLRYVVDSLGQVRPDSMHTQLDEWKDGYLFKETYIDSSRKNASISLLYYFDNGQLKTITTDLNGKRTYRLEVQLDSTGKCITAQSYDSTGKMDAYNTALEQDNNGMVTAGNLFAADSTLINRFKIDYDGMFYMRSETKDSIGKLSSHTIVRRQADHEILVDSTVTFAKDSTHTVVRKFRYEEPDPMKNWTVKTELNESGKPVRVFKRKIIYVSKS